jgi:DNA invertase Pin-like site-specific DNA recombinase
MFAVHDAVMRTTTTRPRRVAVYARVSTDSQSVNNQLEALREVGPRLGWDIRAEFTDRGISGAKGRKDRPEFNRLLQGVTRGEFDLVASWSVDRLGRSLIDLLGFLGELHAKKCGLYLHQQGLDTTTPAGEAMFQMMGVFAQFERAMIRERVKAGMALVQRTGKNKRGEEVTIGRPKVGEKVEVRIRELREEGLGIVSIAKRLGCGVSTVQRVVSEGARAAI